MQVLFKRPDGTFVILRNGFPYHVVQGDALFAAAATAGAAAPLEPAPDPVPAPQTVQISFAQLIGGLVTEGWITKPEGQAWLRGTLPAPVSVLIAQLPEEQQIFAEARALNPTSVLLSDPLVQALAAMQGKTPAQLQAFFNTYGAA
jgi:hypothetical protein